MADESEDTPMQDGETPVRTEEDDEESGSGSGSDSEEEQVEWMVTARQKRSTAGNRLSSLIQQEEPDDELELLFAEADDDAGFEDAEADQSDVQMDSSEDDDDQGPAAAADDLEGEKELQRQAKAEKAKKRKNDGIPIFKKKVKIDPTASQAPPPRPKKKSERTSWIPTAEELPTRASQRGTTKLQKKALHSQLVDREFKRLKQLENMEKAAAAKEAAKKPAMTQADRLAEAARIEKANARSLSRWEEAEQQREEEQRAKLAALSNRHLEGPVITWWSGLAQWAGGRLKQVGKTLMIEEPKEKPVASKKRKLAEMEAESEPRPAEIPKPSEEAPTSKAGPSTAPDQPTARASPSADTGNLEGRPKSSDQIPPPPPTKPESIPPEPKKEVSELPPQPSLQLPTHLPSQQSTQPPSGPVQPPRSQYPLPQAPRNPAPSHPPFILAPPRPWQPHLQPPTPQASLDGSAPVPGLGYNPPPPQLPHLMPSHTTPFAFSAPPPPVEPEVPPPPAQETTSRNLLILSNFDEVQVKSKDVQTQILFRRKFPKASSKNPFLRV